METDFLVVRPYLDAAMKLWVSSIEMKLGKRYPTASLDKFRVEFSERAGLEYPLYPKPLASEGDCLKLPLYMAHLL